MNPVSPLLPPGFFRWKSLVEFTGLYGKKVVKITVDLESQGEGKVSSQCIDSFDEIQKVGVRFVF